MWWLVGVCVAAVYVWVVYYFFVGPTGFRWRAFYGAPKVPAGYEVRGLDISHYQHDIDWPALQREQIGGVPLRFVFVKATEGASHVDEDFRRHFAAAREHGFVRGAYHFYSVRSGAKEQAQFFLNTVQLLPGDLPPVLDVEHKPKDRTAEEFQTDVLTWLHTVEDRYHVKPIIYTYYKFKTEYLADERFDAYPYWIAHYYTDSMEYRGEWRFWQHTDAGRVAGIKGRVDLNIYNGSFYDLQQLAIKKEEED